MTPETIGHLQNILLILCSLSAGILVVALLFLLWKGSKILSYVIDKTISDLESGKEQL